MHLSSLSIHLLAVAAGLLPMPLFSCDLPSEGVAQLEAMGSGSQEFDHPDGWWQTIDYQFQLQFTLQCRFLEKVDDILRFSLVRKEGAIRFWGTAVDHFMGSTDTWQFDDDRIVDFQVESGILEYSTLEDRVVYAAFPLNITSGDIQPNYLRFYGQSSPQFVRLFVALPDLWWFDGVYDACAGAHVADFHLPSVRSTDTVYATDGFEYDAAYGGHWRFVALGAAMKLEFDLEDEVVAPFLTLRHLSSASSNCPGGGFSPIDVLVNGQTVDSCYDPASSHGGTHGFVTDAWDIPGLLQAGTNSVEIIQCDTACTYYWIQSLTVGFVAPDCASCTLTVTDAPSLQTIDPNPALLDGDWLTSLPEKLGTAGRPVTRLAADGLTPLLLRAQVGGPGEVEFRLRDETGSGDEKRVGRLEAIGGAGAATGNPLSGVQAAKVEECWMAFAVLVAPQDFVRDAADEAKESRTLTVEVATEDGKTVSRDVVLVRPPVLLLHGLWGQAASWNYPLQHDPRFTVYAHDYSTSHADPFAVNIGQARAGVWNALQRIRSLGVAATRADVVGHSMGGLLSRLYISGAQKSYERPENFRKGDVHRLITLDTPHFGSPLASILVDVNGNARPVGAAIELVAFDRHVLGCVRCGAVHDLRPDSSVLLGLEAITMPVHAIVGNGGSDLLGMAMEEILMSYPPTKPLGVLLEILDTFEIDLFPALEHDFVVGRLSQEGGLETGSAQTSVFGFDLPPSWGIHTTVTGETRVSDRLIGILNSKADDSLWAEGFPSRREVGGGALPLAMGEVPFRQGTGDLRITSPAPGAEVQAGALLDVTIEPGDGFEPIAVLAFTAVDARPASGSPFAARLSVPAEWIGPLRVAAAARDADGKLVLSEAVEVVVRTSAALTALDASPASLTLRCYAPIGKIRVLGAFDDGLERDISGAGTGTTYEAADSRIASVNADGTVTARLKGTTAIVVRNVPHEAQVEVVVDSAPGDRDSDARIDEADLAALLGCFSGEAGRPDFQLPSLLCRDFFDLDRDLDIDLADLDAFLALYTGPVTDCNGNGLHDARDILAGTNRDCNGNGIPDECDIAAGRSKDADGDGVPDECPKAVAFIGGDTNADASIDLSDAIFILFYLYASGAAPSCLRSADVDGNGTPSLTDAIHLLTWLFLDGKPPSAPFPSCGRDTGSDPVDCVSFPPCP